MRHKYSIYFSCNLYWYKINILPFFGRVQTRVVRGAGSALFGTMTRPAESRVPDNPGLQTSVHDFDSLNDFFKNVGISKYGTFE